MLASSKVLNRYTPRGTSLSVPRKAQAVRSKRSASSIGVGPTRRRPTTLPTGKPVLGEGECLVCFMVSLLRTAVALSRESCSGYYEGP